MIHGVIFATYSFNMRFIFSLLFSIGVLVSLAQNKDSVSNPLNISGSAALTNNGISIIPTFSLNAPAAIFNFYIRKNRFSFDPDIRATLDGRKGSMLFWFRYRIIQDKKFNLTAGIHPAYNLALRTVTDANKSSEITQARRFIAYEIAPSFKVSKHLSFAPYLLRGMGLQKDGPVSSYFVALNTNISNLPFGKQMKFSWTPQFYYLYLDGQEGVYMANILRLSHAKSPFSLSSISNKEIKTNIKGSRNFAWNVILAYNFSGQFKRL